MLSEGARSCRRPSRDVWATLNKFAGLPTPCFITDTARTTAHVIVLDENNFVPENVGLKCGSLLLGIAPVLNSGTAVDGFWGRFWGRKLVYGQRTSAAPRPRATCHPKWCHVVRSVVVSVVPTLRYPTRWANCLCSRKGNGILSPGMRA